MSHSPVRRVILNDSPRSPAILRFNALAAWATLSIVLIAAMFLAATAVAQDLKSLRVGMLQFGTVAWELDVVEHHGLAAREGIELDIVPLSSTNALNVALQSGDVDLVVGDWIWVSRQRAAGREFTSFPYSLQVGSLLVRAQGVESVEQLRGMRVGVAGGPVDKSWLLMRAYTRQTLNEDLADIVSPTYAAPPLLNELALRGDLPAVINYWPYAARLESAGMTPLLEVTEILPKLGIDESVPLLVWLFSETWADGNPELVNGFLRATYAAKQILGESEVEWERIAPLTRAEDEATLRVLRERYRQGIPQRFGKPEIAAAGKMFAILAREGGAELVGPSTSLDPGTFWQGFEIGSRPQ